MKSKTEKEGGVGERESGRVEERARERYSRTGVGEVGEGGRGTKIREGSC